MLRRPRRDDPLPADEARLGRFERRDRPRLADRRPVWARGRASERVRRRPEVARKRRQAQGGVREEGSKLDVRCLGDAAVVHLRVEAIRDAAAGGLVLEVGLEDDVARDGRRRLVVGVPGVDFDIGALPVMDEGGRVEGVLDAVVRGDDSARVEDVVTRVEVDRRTRGGVDRALPDAAPVCRRAEEG